MIIQKYQKYHKTSKYTYEITMLSTNFLKSSVKHLCNKLKNWILKKIEPRYTNSFSHP